MAPIYAHVLPDMQQEAAAKLGALPQITLRIGLTSRMSCAGQELKCVTVDCHGVGSILLLGDCRTSKVKPAVCGKFKYE